MQKIFTAALLVILSISLIKCQVAADEVTDLPGFPYKGKMYSGYLTVNNVKRYHYFFVEAAPSTDTTPLILWLNGGPGCSSMLGMIQENGPAVFQSDDETIKVNEYSWHKLGHMLYIESPGGVGWSVINSTLEEDLYIDDEISAQENFNALQDFFVKYASYKGRDFYISGESYAGIYIPRLAKKIVDYNKKAPDSEKINLKGFLVGNGVASWEYDTTPATLDFAFSHHLVSYDMRKDFNKYCYDEIDEKKCNEIALEILTVNLEGLNTYDLLQECYHPPTYDYKEEDYEHSFYYQYAKWAFPQLKKKSPNKGLNFLSEENDNTKLKLDPPCVRAEGPKKYYNRDDVQNALHVDKRLWEICSEEVGNRYKELPEASLYLYPELVKENLKILIYNGDTDMAVPFNGNQKWIDSLKLEVIKPWRSWRAYNDPLNVAGYRTIYKGLTFVTVKGTGHMVPQWKPKEAFYMLEKYLKDEDL